VEPADMVRENRTLAHLHSTEMESKLKQLMSERDEARIRADELEAQAKNETSPVEKARKQLDAAVQRNTQNSKQKEINSINARINGFAGQPGHFQLLSPMFTEEERRLLERPEWTVLSGNFKEEWTGREAKPSDPILRLGAKEGPWEVELKIPQKHIGQVLRAYQRLNTDVLEVDFLLRSDPTRVFKGKLERGRIAGEANPNKEDSQNESEPVVLAYVRIDGPDIDPEDQLPRALLLTGTEVHAKVRCGPHRLGYSLFYGVWEFFYEKVVFWF
jgi:hypothetical protein